MSRTGRQRKQPWDEAQSATAWKKVERGCSEKSEPHRVDMGCLHFKRKEQMPTLIAKDRSGVDFKRGDWKMGRLGMSWERVAEVCPLHLLCIKIIGYTGSTSFLDNVRNTVNNWPRRLEEKRSQQAATQFRTDAKRQFWT
ncbi:hypothetical protein Tco_0562095 [Tanacetum coccineum]